MAEGLTTFLGAVAACPMKVQATEKMMLTVHCISTCLCWHPSCFLSPHVKSDHNIALTEALHRQPLCWMSSHHLLSRCSKPTNAVYQLSVHKPYQYTLTLTLTTGPLYLFSVCTDSWTCCPDYSSTLSCDTILTLYSFCPLMLESK